MATMKIHYEIWFKNLLRVIDYLTTNGMKYCLFGSACYSFLVKPVATKDIDILIYPFPSSTDLFHVTTELCQLLEGVWGSWTNLDKTTQTCPTPPWATSPSTPSEFIEGMSSGSTPFRGTPKLPTSLASASQPPAKQKETASIFFPSSRYL